MTDPAQSSAPTRVVAPPNPHDLHDAAHDRITRQAQARRIADLLALPFASEAGAGSAYLVPADTLAEAEALRHGVTGPSQLYGGVVPFAFVATKAVTHPLLHPGAAAPQGWNPALGVRLAGSTVSGITAYDAADARAAARRLLDQGPIRIKDVRATAGLGQTVARTVAEIDAALAERDPEVIAGDGIVIEENLIAPRTLSVGTTEIGGDRIAYWGVQRLVRAPSGEEVYGGSDLLVVQGDYAALLAFALPDEARTAIALARTYEAEVFAAYPGLYASRRNYDVIIGEGADGRPRAGVLEQSWRIGGASGAEIAALEAFRADRTPRLVRSETMEIRSLDAPVPEDATLYYRDHDPAAGPLTKYARIVR